MHHISRITSRAGRLTVSAVFLAILATCFVFRAPRASAASISFSFSGPEAPIAVGQEFTVEALVSSDQPLNAYEFDIGFPEDVLEAVRLQDAGSIIDVYPQESRIFGDGHLTVTGASLEPFHGADGKLVTVVFRAKELGTGSIYFGRSFAYLANGKGTKTVPDTSQRLAVLLVEPSTNAVSGATGTVERIRLVPGADTEPPRVGDISFSADPITPAQKLLVYVPSDDGSGVRQAMARSRTLIMWSDWSLVHAPVAFSSGVWSVELEISDHAGNVFHRTIYDWGAFGRNIWPPGALGIALFAALWYVFRRRMRRRP